MNQNLINHYIHFREHNKYDELKVWLNNFYSFYKILALGIFSNFSQV